jgi:hypothetical protein
MVTIMREWCLRSDNTAALCRHEWEHDKSSSYFYQHTSSAHQLSGCTARRVRHGPSLPLHVPPPPTHTHTQLLISCCFFHLSYFFSFHSHHLGWWCGHPPVPPHEAARQASSAHRWCLPPDRCTHEQLHQQRYQQDLHSHTVQLHVTQPSLGPHIQHGQRCALWW